MSTNDDDIEDIAHAMNSAWSRYRELFHEERELTMPELRWLATAALRHLRKKRLKAGA